MKPDAFHVYGDVAAQGSKRLCRLRTGRTVLIEQSRKVKPWRSAVAAAATDHGCAMRHGFVRVRIALLFARPASHFKKNGILKPNMPNRPGYIDVDKAARAILDALAGIAYINDRQVAALSVQRDWAMARPPGAVIEISDLDDFGPSAS